MKKALVTATLVTAFAAAGLAHAQQAAQGGAGAPVAGRSTLGVTVEQMNVVVAGWSAKKAILGKNVYNDQNQKVGKIDDIVVAPDNSISVAVVGAGGFLGMGKHDVAIPMSQLQSQNDRFVLPGATKDALKALPAFEYARRK